MVYGLFFCATLTGRRGGHTPLTQAGASNGRDKVFTHTRCQNWKTAAETGKGLNKHSASKSHIQAVMCPSHFCRVRVI